MLTEFEAIGFDHTGVIAGESSHSFDHKISKITGVPIPDFHAAYRNHNKAFLVGEISLEELWKRVLKLVDREIHFEQVINEVTKPKKIDHEVVSLIKELRHREYKLGLLSNGSMDAAKHIRETEKLGELFHTISISIETGFVKPEKEAFLDLTKKLKTIPERMLFIDDVQSNLDTAREIGFHTILHTDAVSLRSALSEKGIL